MADSTFLLGVTGGIGSGKSSACKVLEKLGAVIFDSDAAAKQAMKTDKLLIRDLKNEFGNDIFQPYGELNTGYLAEIVFNSADKLNSLNALVHPYVFELFKGVVQSSNQLGKPMLVKEAALIFETGSDTILDAVLVIDAPREVRIKRVMDRNGIEAEEVEKRMSFQYSSEELVQRADYVIENTGTLEELTTRVGEVYTKILSNT